MILVAWNRFNVASSFYVQHLLLILLVIVALAMKYNLNYCRKRLGFHLKEGPYDQFLASIVSLGDAEIKCDRIYEN